MSSDQLQQLQDQIFSSNKTVAPSSVLINLALTSGLSLATIITFNILRPRNRVIYEPKSKYYVGDKQPPRIKSGFFSWLSPLIHSKEPELLDKIGPDAVVFLRFLRLLRWLFTVLAFIGCAITMPVDIVYNLRNSPKGKTVLSMLTVQDVKGDYLFVHVAATYLCTFAVMGFCWWHWRAVVQLRHQWFRSDEYTKSFYARTLMVQHVPRKMQSDEGLQSLFEQLRVPYPTTAVHIGRRVGNLPDLIEYHNKAVRELEGYLVMYLKDGKMAKKRPTITKGGFLGIGGKKIDAIDYWTSRIKSANEAIDRAREQIDLRKPEPYGFASMASVPYAHVVARILTGKSKKGAMITLAPNPKDIVWNNLTRSDASTASSKLIGFLLLCLVCAFYTIPLSIVSFVANLSAIQAWVPFLQKWAQKSQFTFSVVSGVLPPLISAFFGWALPKIMRRLSKYQGAITRSRLDRAVVARYFGFLVASQLILFTIIGVLYQSVTLVIFEIGQHNSFMTILKNFNKLPGQIQTTYIQQSSYWLTFFPTRGFLAVFDLAQLLNLVWISIKTRLFGRTPRDIREWTQPPSFEYAVYYSNMLFMATVALVYTPLAPLVAVAAAVVFWISGVVYKYQLMFVFTTKVESGGRLWNTVINRLLAGTIFMQLLMVLTIGLVHGWKSFLWVSAAPPILIILIFKQWLVRVYMKDFRFYVPSEEDIARSKIWSDAADAKADRLSRRFGHPALHADLYTPMVHSNMIGLLAQVYHGRLSDDTAGLSEYGNQKVGATITPGGLKIAGIDENQLEYDPALYQRDRGEADWDTRSIASTDMLHRHHPSSPSLGKDEYFHSRSPSGTLAGYDSYMARGPSGSQHGHAMYPGANASTDSNIELARLDYNRTTDNLPLLVTPGDNASEYGRHSPAPPLSRYPTTESANWNSPLQPQPPQRMYSPAPPMEQREAPTHRGYTSRQGSTDALNLGNYTTAEGGMENYAGRGALAYPPGPPSRQQSYDALNYPPPQNRGDPDNFAGRGARRGAY
ncbi:DUF221-domain-containing protein [Clavulina sp. PMI_390]|nr:DUF221-domain-containing protein [Clavulina sp. PMI_390]